MTKTITTLGELMMRLKPPGKLRLRQATSLDVCFGGAEANVAVSLACFGHDSRFISALPNTELGEQALVYMRGHGVDTRLVQRRAGRLGLYFMEEGADFRSGCVIYDRADSAFNHLKPETIDWNAAFDGADWFHISGVTPAVSEAARELAHVAMTQARARGVHVSLDLNYRERLWSYGAKANEIMPDLAALADTLIAGRGDCLHCLDIDGEGENGSDDWAQSLTSRAMERFPNIRRMALTLRNSTSADRHAWRAYLHEADAAAFSRTYDMRHIVDRVGTGDAFSAGLIYAALEEMPTEDAVNFGAAANCLKHAVIGDGNIATADEVKALAATETFGLLRR